MTATAPPLAGDDQEREQELRFHKARATGLLIAATIAYIVLRILTEGDGWTGYAEAAAEAAMVGGIADWFAVTALFKHPLALPIPHTAIIPKRKDQIGRALGGFVQENFLQAEVLGERLAQANIAERLGVWLEQPDNAKRVGDQAASVLAGVIEVMKDEQVQTSLDGIMRRRVENFDPAPVLGRAIDFAIDGDHHHAVFDATLNGVSTMIRDNRPMLRKRLASESPWWVPEPLDDRIFDKIYSAIHSFVSDVRSDPNHEVRDKVDERIAELAVRLKESPDFRARGDELKQEILEHPEVRAWTTNLWANIKESLLLAADDPESELRQRLHDAAVSAGESLRNDPGLRAKVDDWLIGVVSHLATESRSEVADLIANTVEGWDADETSKRIELQVGRDLQYIRINGTIVGGLAGVVIHGVAQLLP